MMDSGRIVLDIKGEERDGLTVDGLLEKFSVGVGKELDNDLSLIHIWSRRIGGGSCQAAGRDRPPAGEERCQCRKDENVGA